MLEAINTFISNVYSLIELIGYKIGNLLKEPP